MGRRLALLAASVGVAACHSADAPIDAAGPPPWDAVTLPDAHGIYPDAGPIPELPPPACATTGETTVIAQDALGMPVADLNVFYSNPDGTLQGTGRTDAAGRALALLPAGTQVTLAFVANDLSGLFPMRLTWMDPPPGACLRFRRRPTLASIGFTTFIPPDPPADSQFVTARLFGSSFMCAVTRSGFDPIHVYVDDACVAPPGFVSAIMLASDSTGHVVAFTPPQDVPFPDDHAFIMVPEWRTDFIPWTLTVVNDTTERQTAEATYVQTRRGRALSFGESWIEDIQPGSGALLSRSLPAFDPELDGVLYTISISQSLATGAQPTRRTRRIGAGTTDAVVASELPPPVDDITIDDRFSPRPVISWTGPQPPAADAVIVDLWSPGVDSELWVVLADPARSQIQLPELPAALDPWPSETGVMDYWVHHLDVAEVDGYAAATGIEQGEEDLLDPYSPTRFYDPRAPSFTSTFTTSHEYFY